MSKVYWIEPSHRAYTIEASNKFVRYSLQNGNSEAQTSTRVWDAGLRGQDEIIGCGDTGIDMNHCFFYDSANPSAGPNHRKVVNYAVVGGDNGDQIDGHGSHVVGTILGSPNTGSASSIFDYRGSAPDAKISFIDIQQSSSLSLTIPSDMSSFYDNTYNTKARVHCDAWNSQVGPFYTSMSEQIDDYQYKHKDFLVIRSAGNTKDFEYNSVYTISQEATSKNSLVIGSYNQDKTTFGNSINYFDFDNIYQQLRVQVCDNNNPVYGLKCTDLPSGGPVEATCCANTILSLICCKANLQNQFQNNGTYSQYTISTFSGMGPTADGRLKPDLVAPGAPVISARSLGSGGTAGHCSADTFGSGTPSLVAMEGTSQSAAVTASAAALVRQYFREGYFLNGQKNSTAGFNPSGALIKSTLINLADIISDNQQAFLKGYGRMNLKNLPLSNSGETINIPGTTDPVINTEKVNMVCYEVLEESDLTITLTWTDPAGSPLSPISLVNNLDLAVVQYIDYNTTTYFGNGKTDSFDTINNVETVRLLNTKPGRYDINVIGSNIPVPDQSYGLVVRGKVKQIQCSECYYTPEEKQDRECYIENGIGIQTCKSNNLYGKCEIYSCNSGYVIDKGITKSCVTMLALTLYNIALLGAFGLIIVAGVVFILITYKSKSLDQEKYQKLSKKKNGKRGKGGKGDDNDNGGDNGGGNGNGNRGGNGNGSGNGNGKDPIPLTHIGVGNNNHSNSNNNNNIQDGDNDNNNNNNNNIQDGDNNNNNNEIQNTTMYDEEFVQEEPEISIIEIISIAKPESGILAGALLLSFIDIGLGLAVPLVSANIFDLLYSGKSGDISTVILTFALIIIGMLIVQFFYGILLALAGHKIIARLRKEMFSSILKQDMNFFNERKTGELMSRLASDVSSVRSIISDSIPHMITQTATILGSLIMIFIISWKLSLVVLSPLPVLLVSSHFYGNYIETISIKVQDALAEAATHAAETLFNIKTVRWFSAEEKENAKFARLIHISYKIALRMTIWNGIYSSTSGIFEQLSIFILLWYGTSLVRNGDLTPSMLIAFNLFLPFITQAVTQLTSLYTTYKSYKGSSYRFFEIMQRIPEINSNVGITKDRVNGVLEFNNVSFAYMGREDSPVIENVNISFKPGSITALIGPSGGGKSTMLSLIGRLYNINGGTISLDGTDIKDWNVSNLHEHISIVNQEPSLFSGTIAENVAYGKENATRQQIIDACKQANAHDFISQLPDGYDTIIGERGASLSGGQKQRVAIARTIIKNPTVILFDEATSELDVESERLVQEAIDKLVQNRTVIIVAHRLSTILTADIIAVVSDGTISERGTPEELLAKKGMFYEFVQIQYGTQGEDLQISLPTKSRNADRLRQRSETIKRVALEDNGPSSSGGRPHMGGLLDNDKSSLHISQIKRPPSPPMWRKGKKNTTGWKKANKGSLLVRKGAIQPLGSGNSNIDDNGWRRGTVDDKLQRVLAKTRKKGFFNEDRKDIKGALVLY
eukprot:gene9172-11241_t